MKILLLLKSEKMTEGGFEKCFEYNFSFPPLDLYFSENLMHSRHSQTQKQVSAVWIWNRPRVYSKESKLPQGMVKENRRDVFFKIISIFSPPTRNKISKCYPGLEFDEKAVVWILEKKWGNEENFFYFKGVGNFFGRCWKNLFITQKIGQTSFFTSETGPGAKHRNTPADKIVFVLSHPQNPRSQKINQILWLIDFRNNPSFVDNSHFNILS